MQLQKAKHLDLLKNNSFSKKLETWYQIHKFDHLWRRHWQKNQDPFFVWVSEIMLQQTTIAAVIPAYKKFIEKFPGIVDFSQASDGDIRAVFQGLGYYRRFFLLQKGARSLVEKEISTLKNKWPASYPKTFKELLELSGVGVYTAAAIASICFQEKVASVDGNFYRVFARLFDLRQTVDECKTEIFDICQKLIQDSVRPGDFNQAVMEIGQTICRVEQPKCLECPINSFCLAMKNNTQSLSPAPKKEKNYIDVKAQVFLIKKSKSNFKIIKRTEKNRFLKQTLGFPFVMKFPDKDWMLENHSFSQEEVGKFKERFVRLGGFKHSITHHKIACEVYLGEDSLDKFDELETQEVDISNLKALLTSSLDLKALRIAENFLNG